MNNNLREITDKALSGLVGIIASAIIFFCFAYPLILKIARIYNGQKMKYYWHVHHDVICESSDNIKERREYIKKNKPEEEIEIRLKLLKEVKGQSAQAELDAANKAELAFEIIREIWDDGNWEADKAWLAAYKAWQDEIEALHKIECPNCPWDGQTIFPKVNNG